MKALNKRALLLGLLAVVGSLAAIACRPGSEPGDSDKLVVTVTIYPVEYVTAQVGGDRVDIVKLIPAGTDAHDFEPTPGDIRTIAESDLVVFNHSAFEGWILDAIEASGSDIRHVQLADLPQGVEFAVDHGEEESDDHEGTVDPHVWLDPVEVITMVNRVRDAFSEIDPEGATYYGANAAALAARLEALDGGFASGLTSCQHAVFVASHLAYGHLAERYGLGQIGLSGLSDESESGPQHVAEIVEQIRDLGLQVILVEPFSNQALAETAARETGAQLLPLHPLESLTQAEVEAGDDYFTVMERNLASLRTALNCSG